MNPIGRYAIEHTQDEFGQDVWWVSDLTTELGDDAAGENFPTEEAAAEWIEQNG